MRRKVQTGFHIPWHRDGLRTDETGNHKGFVVSALHVNIPPSVQGGDFETIIDSKYYKHKVKTGDSITFFDDRMFHKVTPVTSSIGGAQYANRSTIFLIFFTRKSTYTRGLVEKNRNRNYLKMYYNIKNKYPTLPPNNRARLMFNLNASRSVNQKNINNANKIFTNMVKSFATVNRSGVPTVAENKSAVIFQRAPNTPEKVLLLKKAAKIYKDATGKEFRLHNLKTAVKLLRERYNVRSPNKKQHNKTRVINRVGSAGIRSARRGLRPRR